LVAGLAVAASMSFAVAASAQVASGDWRQRSRPSRTDRSKQNFAAELRFGGYYPQIDSEFHGSATPYKDVFGSGPRFYFGLEFDWQAIRIPYVGVIGPGLGWGRMSTSTKAKVSGTTTESAEDTSLTIMPMHLSGVLRLDELMRRTGFPLVPYAKAGLGFGMWSTANSGDVAYYPRQPDPNALRGRGTTWGEHFALGAMLSLNWLDKKAAASMDDNTGVNHIYLFGEWMDTKLDGIGKRPQMHIGSSSWVVGLALDM
jgi:hypothetical protein